MAIERLTNARETKPHRACYHDVAYWSAHPDERDYELERIRGALVRCATPDREIEASLARVRKAMSGA